MVDNVGKDGGCNRDVLHALGGAGPVAVVEVDAFALEDEGAHAILCGGVRCGHRVVKKQSYLALGDLLDGLEWHRYFV